MRPLISTGLLAALALFLLMAMTFADVVLRSTVNNPILAATEMTSDADIAALAENLKAVLS